MDEQEVTDNELQQFTGNVRHLIMLQDQMKDISAKAREARVPVKEAYDNVQLTIIDFMKDKDIHVCNYKEEKIELQMVSRTGSLTKKTLLAGLTSYFNSESQAEQCMTHVIASLGVKELDVLKRVKKRKGRKKASTGSSPVPPPEPVVQEEEEEEVPEVSDDE